MTRLEIHNKIQLAHVEVSERAIKELLDICQALNERIGTLEADANRSAASTAGALRSLL